MRIADCGIGLVLIAALLVGLAGCGGPGYEHGTVHGKVTIDGEPVPKGAITFSPSGKGQGPVAGGKIENGEFRVEKVAVGPNTVTFTAQAAQMREIQDVAAGTTRQVPIDLLPAHHRKGESAEVKSGTQEINFQLTKEPPTTD